MNDLIERAIQSAEARIYKIVQSKDRNHTARHQEKAENQIELQKVTVDALRKQLPMKLVIQETDEKYHYKCKCGNILLTKYKDGYRLGATFTFCEICGQKLDWGEE